MLHHYRAFISLPALLIVLLCSAAPVYSFERHPAPQITYQTRIGEDLDGDQKPETVTVRQAGFLYQISIHFTTGSPRVHFDTHITEGTAGVTFQAADINNDRRGDLVVVSATSLRPVAVWLNQGRARFKKVQTSFFGTVGRYRGPTYGVEPKSSPEPDGNIAFDPAPQATFAAHYLPARDATSSLLFRQIDQRPVDSLLRQVPPRGPPAPARA